MNSKSMDQKAGPKRPRDRPVKRHYAERIDGTPERIAKAVLRMPPKYGWPQSLDHEMENIRIYIQIKPVGLFRI